MFKRTCTHDLFTALSIPWLLTLYFCACQRVCTCRVYMCAGWQHVSVLKATLVCCKEGRRGCSLRKLRRFDPSISPSHLSVYEIHRELRGSTCWHMHSVDWKSVMVCGVTEKAATAMDASDRQAGGQIDRKCAHCTTERTASPRGWTDTRTDRQSDR